MYPKIYFNIFCIAHFLAIFSALKNTVLYRWLTKVENGSVWLIDKWKKVLYDWLTSGKQFCMFDWQVENNSVSLLDKWKAVPYDWLTSGKRFRMIDWQVDSGSVWWLTSGKWFRIIAWQLRKMISNHYPTKLILWNTNGLRLQVAMI